MRESVNQLDGLIPDLSHLKNLGTLTLSDNNFSGPLPKLDKFPGLKEVWLANNNFTGSLEDYTISNPLLRRGTFEGNKLTFSNIIKYHDKIKTLIEVTNKWSQSLFSYAPQQKIYVDTAITIPAYSNYPLDLKIDDTVTTSIYTWFKNDTVYKIITGKINLQGLSTLYLPENNISGNLPSFKYLKNLTDLTLNHNMFTGSFPNIDSLKDLVVLGVLDNKLSGPLPILNNNKKIKDLNWGHNNFKGLFPDNSVLHPSLISNTIDDNKLTFEHLIQNLLKVQRHIENNGGFNRFVYAPQQKSMLIPPSPSPPALTTHLT
ncbi:MAG: hypothetical protein IPF93_15565 [Saprospiraceae bacterium]|nr:hypothetical protein [Saprospiraceae bacterium]